MGCTPSIHVSHIYCHDNDESPSQHPAVNHQPTPPAPIANKQRSGPSGLPLNLQQQQSHGRTGTQAWDRYHPVQSEHGHLRLYPMKVVGQLHKVLLVFGREDSVSEAWWLACKRQGHEVSLARNLEDTLKAFLDHTHDLIIIDARSSKHINA
ncbi:high affinity cAMP-specific and IBMX-insensitive 3',5'-cyclic phosphodiesterase 8B-like, partial [Penaeus monodon]|uniref:high affinity cAMP-specific and IBMX-insensitive 3',5'-cyclic phosphodiesterase 8B-like n=1 Tax=Penaeus monodon TaxID=6687 RepID=UPI0018A74AEF